MAATIVDTAVVGREAELIVLERFLDDVVAAPGGIVVQGEAGIGKTVLWLAALRIAVQKGIRVLQARPAESEAKLSYAALGDLVGTAFDETRGSLAPVQERALAATLLRVGPDEAASLRTTATAVVNVLEEIARHGPVLLAIDDAQWLDAASEQVLEFVFRRLPSGVGVLVTRRGDGDSEPPLGLGQALPEDRVSRISLGPLSLAALHHLLVRRLGATLRRPLLARLAGASGGNPLYALEIARAMAVEATASFPGEPLPIPASLEQLVHDRLARLSDPAKRVALAASALSRPTVDDVAQALDDGDDLSAALLEAEEVGVLLTERGRILFSHPLLASVTYAAAPRERRRRLHERLASVVVDPEERARHLAAGAAAPDEKIASVVERAADRAARLGAHVAAAELFASARNLTGDAHHDARMRRSLGEAGALFATGDVEDARTLAEQALASAEPMFRARAHYLLGEIAWAQATSAPSEHFEAALAAAPDDRALAARIYPMLVGFTIPHDPLRAIAHAEAAMRLLDPAEEPGPLAAIVFGAFFAAVISGQPPDRSLFERWQELEAAAGPDAPKSSAPLIYCWHLDDFEGARARYAVEGQWYRDRGEDILAAERLGVLGAVEMRAGRWDVAERYLEEACDALTHVAKASGAWALPFAQRATFHAHTGQSERARAVLVPLLETAEAQGQTFWAITRLTMLAFVDFVEGDHVAVDRALTRMAELRETIGVHEFPAARTEPFHIESLVALGELGRAREVIAQLEERGRTLPRLWITTTLPRARALVLAGEGEIEQALAALDALDHAEAAKLPFDLGWTLLVRGRLERRAKRRSAAAGTLREALAIFERLGAPVFAAHARAELDRVGLRRAPDDLTATERRVAELAAQGLTNREVANNAYMSPRTVQANLVRIYRKLGIRSRAELGAKMASESTQSAQQK